MTYAIFAFGMFLCFAFGFYVGHAKGYNAALDEDDRLLNRTARIMAAVKAEIGEEQ